MSYEVGAVLAALVKCEVRVLAGLAKYGRHLRRRVSKKVRVVPEAVTPTTHTQSTTKVTHQEEIICLPPPFAQ